MTRGIDVSEHQAIIAWDKVVNDNIDFAIIRAGYGKNNCDKYFERNIKGCIDNNIPFGIYWFSYATGYIGAGDEARYAVDTVSKYTNSCLIGYDWEYDSDNYAKRNGKNITNQVKEDFARIFIEYIKTQKYIPYIYTNIDYYNKVYHKFANKCGVWLAAWRDVKPSIPCDIWQFTNCGSVSGISGNVDMNICYTDVFNIEISNANDNEIIKEKMWKKYYNIALDIIAGKYGNGKDRRNKLTHLGYDYEIAQMVVNTILNSR